MDAPKIVLVFLVIILTPVVVLPLILGLFKRQMKRLKADIERSGDALLLGPSTGLYQGGSWFVSMKTYGAMALTDRGLIFRQPIGRDIVIPLSQVIDVSKLDWFRGNHRAGRAFLVIKNVDGTEAGFIVKNEDQWIEQIQARIEGHQVGSQQLTDVNPDNSHLPGTA